MLLGGVWLIGQFVGGEDTKPRPQVIIESAPKHGADVVTTEVPASDTKTSLPNAPIPTVVEASRWIRGSQVAFRDGPGKEHSILDRFNSGRAVGLIESDGEWSKVRDELTRREGWVASRLLTDRRPEAREPDVKKKEPDKREPVVAAKPQISDATIIEQIIAQSIANYSGNCPCPFNTDRAGRRCGKRSAYSRPGGASPICFVGDVTPDMIASFRNR
jgi:SH3-like domain-containing protein